MTDTSIKLEALLGTKKNRPTPTRDFVALHACVQMRRVYRQCWGAYIVLTYTVMAAYIVLTYIVMVAYIVMAGHTASAGALRVGGLGLAVLLMCLRKQHLRHRHAACMCVGDTCIDMRIGM